MKIEILDQAREDLIEGFYFYEDQQAGLGSYFLTNLYRGHYRLLSRRFPFAVFYRLRETTVLIHAVLDCRRDPAWIRKRLAG